MSALPLDPSPWVEFSNKVRFLYGSPVIFHTLDDARCFWLFASFARSKFKLDETNVGVILQYARGGVVSDFAVVEVKNWILSSLSFQVRWNLLSTT
jgi:hypothetical protein